MVKHPRQEILRSCSSELIETDLVGLFSEASSTEHELVLSDETLGGSATSAGAGVLSVFSGMRVKLVRHFSTIICSRIKSLFINNSINTPKLYISN